MPRVLRYLLYIAVAMIVVWSPRGLAQQGAKDGEWRAYAGEAGSSRYSPVDQIACKYDAFCKPGYVMVCRLFDCFCARCSKLYR